MRINLPPKLEELVRRKVESGEYRDESDVVGAALRQMAASDAAYETKLERLRQALVSGEQSGFVEDFSMDRLIEEIEEEERREALAHG
jgi:antitoxin ParD1/3/4